MFVFHPDPPAVSQTIAARLTYADGRTARWRPPQDARFLGAQRAARWAKYGEFVRPLAHGEHAAGEPLWRPLAAWLARTRGTAANPVTKVELLAVDRPIPEVGRRERPAPVESVFFTYELPA
jgi:hypothetical protein